MWSLPDEVVAVMSGGIITVMASSVYANRAASDSDAGPASPIVGLLMSIASAVEDLRELVPGGDSPLTGVAVWHIVYGLTCLAFFGPILMRRHERVRVRRLEGLETAIVASGVDRDCHPAVITTALRQAMAQESLFGRLAGRWTYRVTSSRSDYLHEGTCCFRRTSEGALCLTGEREQTRVRQGGSDRSLLHDDPVHWKADHLAFVKDSGGDGLMFDYHIDIEGAPRRGLCVVLPMADGRSFKGEFAYFDLGMRELEYTSEPGPVVPTLICGQITFEPLEDGGDSVLTPHTAGCEGSIPAEASTTVP